MKYDNLNDKQLLLEYCKIQDAIRERKLRSPGGNPVAGYAELLVCERLGLCCEDTEERGRDAIDPKTQEKYETKHTRAPKSTPKTGRINGLDDETESQPFDFLVFIVFNQDLTVRNVYRIPCETVREHKQWSNGFKGYFISMNDRVLGAAGVKDIRDKFL